MKNRLMALVGPILLAFLAAQAVAGTRVVRSVEHDGLTRRYIAHVPEQASDPLSVIFALHPGYGTGRGFERQLALHEDPAAKDYVIVYPTGIQRSWNSGYCCGKAFANQVDDVGFIMAILAQIGQDLPLSQDRHFATGFSNGAMLAQRLACEQNTVFAGFVAMGGNRDYRDGCDVARPVSGLFLHGLLDAYSPIEGGQGKLKRPGVRPSLYSNVDFWVAHNHCQASSSTTRLGAVPCTRHSSCDQDSIVELCLIKDLGHWMPGQTATSDRQRDALGPDRPDLDARSEIFRFFATLP